jgi:hypothetical protein
MQRKPFLEYHTENPNIYEMFKKFTFKLINRGYKRFGPNAILARIRWETAVSETGSDFKICENYLPYYSRLFLRDYPEHAGFFKL